MTATDNARFLSLVSKHTDILADASRHGFTPERQATLDAIEAELDALAEAAEIAHYGAAL